MIEEPGIDKNCESHLSTVNESAELDRKYLLDKDSHIQELRYEVVDLKERLQEELNENRVILLESSLKAKETENLLLKDMIAMQEKMIDMKEERIDTLLIDTSKKSKKISDQKDALYQKEKMLAAKESELGEAA